MRGSTSDLFHKKHSTGFSSGNKRVSKNIYLIFCGLLASCVFLPLTETNVWSFEKREEIPSVKGKTIDRLNSSPAWGNLAPPTFHPIEIAQLFPGRVRIQEGGAERPKESKLQFSENKLKQSGFIVPATSPVGTIIKSFNNHNMFHIDDVVYIDFGSELGASKGDQFTILSQGRTIHHPVLKEGSRVMGILDYQRTMAQPNPTYFTRPGKMIGRLVNPLGVLKIIESKPGSSKAIIQEVYSAISQGDYIIPFEKTSAPPRNPEAKGDESLEGYVVAYLMEHSLGGLNDIVYIDLGSDNGVTPGDRFEVFVTPIKKQEKHWNQYQEAAGTPMIPHVIAELQVLDSQRETSTGIVISSRYAIPLGAPIRYKPVDVVSPPLANVAALKNAPAYATADNEFPLESPTEDFSDEEPFAGFDSDVIEKNTKANAPLMAFAPSLEMKDIHFSFDQYALDKVSREIMLQNLEYLKKSPNIHTQIQGHCDERGTNNYNLALGERRANTIKNFLQSQGIQKHRLHLISYGEESPVCHESGENCWRHNRRVHFMVSEQNPPVN